MTVGADIFFARGVHAPGTARNDEPLAHELTRVVQEYHGRTRADVASAHVSSPDESLERAAGAAAERIGDRREATQSGWPDLDAVTEEAIAALAPRLGLDAATVNVRTDDDAARRVAAAGASGLMEAGVVYLRPDRYDSTTERGRYLLAHELTHVAQSRLAPSFDGSSGSDAAEAEATQIGQAWARGESFTAPKVSLSAATAADTGPNVTHNGYHSFYLRGIIPTSGNTEVRVQFHQDPASPGSAIVAIWYQESGTLQQATVTSRGAIRPRLLDERSGIARFDLDGDGVADVDVIARPNQRQGVDFLVNYSGARVITMSTEPRQPSPLPYVPGRGRLIGRLPDGRNYYWTGMFDYRGPRYVDEHGMMVDPGREAAAAELNRAFSTFFVGWMILSASVAAIAVVGIAAAEVAGAGAAGEAATAAAARQGLIAALRAAGVRFTESAIQGITRTIAGRIVWLETGGATAGLTHIMQRHAAQFATRWGLTSAEQVVRFIINTVATQAPVATQAAREFDYLITTDGVERLLRIIIGSNGFIVTAYPI